MAGPVFYRRRPLVSQSFRSSFVDQLRRDEHADAIDLFTVAAVTAT